MKLFTIKDEIYKHPIIFLICEKEEREKHIEMYYKKKGIKYEKLEKDEIYGAVHFCITDKSTYENFWLWMDKSILNSFKHTTITICHELSHHIDKVFDKLGLLKGNLHSITETRAYYHDYLLEQIIEKLYPKHGQKKTKIRRK